ncbi:MAG: ABC transporter ATP-binding protein [Anaerohalosphaeraceae bacterium]
MDTFIVQTEGLVKYYDGRAVLKGVTLKIPQGCIYGLLGRNGAGKTTLIRILLGLESPTRGRAFLFGQDSQMLSRKTKTRIGYTAEGHPLIGTYTAGRLAALCRGLAGRWNQSLFEELAGLFNLPMNRKVKDLSAGMRAQLDLTLAMAAEPELLILDDPTLGLDTVVRRQFLELAIDVIQRQGRTILFSSHILSDVERIADRIGILVNGWLAADCTLEGLKNGIRKFRVIFSDQAPERLYLTELIRQHKEGRELVFTAANWNPLKMKMVQSLQPQEIVEIPMNLEEIFLECTRTEPVYQMV